MGAGFDLHFASRRTVISQRQLDILAYLSGFARDLEDSWDVPRGLSLVGLAEHLGVVRSALNVPLKSLQDEGLVSSRTAHVIGASRRRKVFHVTQKGREASESEGVRPQRGRSVGPIPDPMYIQGRDGIVERVSAGLSDGTNLLLEGLPGIGKTSVACAVSHSMLKGGWQVRWATCNTDSDASAVAGMWIGDRAPASSEAIAAKVDSKRTLLVLDEAQQVSSRHVAAIQRLIEDCSETSATVLAVTRAPNPFSGLSGFDSVRLEGLEPSLARGLLPAEMDEEEAMDVCRAMDGHPLGIKLWSPEDDLPGAGAVQEYVESTVIRRLSEDGTSSLDELSISPLALRIEEILDPSGVEELDDSAILRWSGLEVEPHHLVRNVRRASIPDERASELHSKMVEAWSSREGTRARRMEAHHRLESGTEDSGWLKEYVPEIASEDTSAAAVVLEQAISMMPEEALVEMAADIALERGEAEIASSHIESLSEGPSRDLRSARLARVKGDWKLAEALESSAVSDLEPGQRARAQISSLVRRYDDRLPGNISEKLAEELMAGTDSVDLSQLEADDRALGSLALDLLRHSLALELGDLEAASRTRASLEDRMGPDDPRLYSLDLRARLSAGSEGDAFLEALESARSHIDSSDDPMDALRTIHLSLESCTEPPDWLIERHSSFDPGSLRDDLASHRRAASHWWYWRGVLERDDRLSSWKEAIQRLRTAECTQASKELIGKLSKEL